MAVILRYFSEFAYLQGVLRKRSRSLSHLLMSSCNTFSYYDYVVSVDTIRYQKLHFRAPKTDR